MSLACQTPLSVQPCMPFAEDSSGSLRRHLPLSPCSSVGSVSSYYSTRSSNADSAVDMAMPDDDTLEVEVCSTAGSAAAARVTPTVRLKQTVFVPLARTRPPRPPRARPWWTRSSRPRPASGPPRVQRQQVRPAVLHHQRPQRCGQVRRDCGLGGDQPG